MAAQVPCPAERTKGSVQVLSLGRGLGSCVLASTQSERLGSMLRRLHLPTLIQAGSDALRRAHIFSTKKGKGSLPSPSRTAR